MNQRTKKPLSPKQPKRSTLARQLVKAIKRQSAAPVHPLAAICQPASTAAPKPVRVFGPYQTGNRWRLILRDGAKQHALPFTSQAEAEEAKAQMLATLTNVVGRTVGDALAEFLAHKREMGCKEITITTCRDKLLFLPQEATLSSITPAAAESLYRAQTAKVRPATHHKNLRTARAFFAFCMRQRWIALNPFVEVRAVGKASAGKPQLRRDEAKRLIDRLLQEAERGDRSALALLTQLLMGLRSGEVLNLRKRDLDADGTILIVEGTKTKNAKRQLSLPAVLRGLLARQAAPLAPEALIFVAPGRSKPLPTDHLFKRLHKLCAQAGVPKVCPHSLRGLHSSLAVQAGATSAVVAAALGHGSDSVTRKHYIAPEAIESARSACVVSALLAPDLDKLIATLRSLPPAQRAYVLSSVENSL